MTASQLSQNAEMSATGASFTCPHVLLSPVATATGIKLALLFFYSFYKVWAGEGKKNQSAGGRVDELMAEQNS